GAHQLCQLEGGRGGADPQPGRRAGPQRHSGQCRGARVPVHGDGRAFGPAPAGRAPATHPAGTPRNRRRGGARRAVPGLRRRRLRDRAGAGGRRGDDAVTSGTAWLFPGQGSDLAAAPRGALENAGPVRRLLAVAGALLREQREGGARAPADGDLAGAILRGDPAVLRTEIAQPALVAGAEGRPPARKPTSERDTRWAGWPPWPPPAAWTPRTPSPPPSRADR